ncbi:hypothetical protein [Stieleria mannarensis]|uniref:hypothetical protein n=1 Tax=Stieleria mannarensis TaxID=2755585 RepID=UPI00160305EC|nr:hypothetical protein [Rhodopirellula sp. JC639]
MSRRWVYLQLNLQVEANVAKAVAIAKRAKAAGYNSIVLADYKLNILDRVPRHYFRHVEQFKESCRQLELEIIPAVCPIGYSDGLLAHNPNLAEGLPVKDAAFVVRDGTATLTSRESFLPGGDFESFREHIASGWNYQDFPKDASFIDTELKHGGRAALRFESLVGRNGRVIRKVAVQPYQLLHASVWIRTDRFSTAGNMRMMAIGADGRTLSYSNLGVKPTQGWRQHHVMFNTLDNTEINFYVGCWNGGDGRFWLDDVRLEESAFVNLVRRDSCPLKVQIEGGRELREGVDFAPLADPKLGNVPYSGSYDVYHEPPKLRLLPAAKVSDGDRLRVSYYHTVTIYENQVTCCLADPEVFRVLAKQVKLVEELFSPRTYFLSHDEIRVADWCPACHRDGRSAGELLARNIRQCAAVVRQINRQAKLCVWSDMFDPHHNARDKFYLVQGDLARSWEGLPDGMTIVNWNHGQASESLPFFGKQGFKQVLAGYYDSDPRRIRSWLSLGDDDDGINGVMYTTWTGNFDHLEAFAEAAWDKE